MKTTTFYQPRCAECSALLKASSSYANSYCTGFPGKRQKRFPKDGPKAKVPDWCPKRITPPACRVYGFINDDEAAMEFMLNFNSSILDKGMVFPQERRYKVRCDYQLGMTAKELYEALQRGTVSSIFPNIEFEFGEIVEIDDGLKPYYFYYTIRNGFVMAPNFDRTKTMSERKSKNEQTGKKH